LGTYENDDGEDIVFDDWIDENIGLLGTFYNTSGTTRGQERTGKKWALRAYWDDIKGNANDNNHCAAFPLELVERHLALYTKPDEVVYEPFSGSGTTIISCERFRRKCRAIELDPGYCAVAIQRWVDVTGGVPELLQ
jgi:DNA modification methylase